jgi:hypothetical protein
MPCRVACIIPTSSNFRNILVIILFGGLALAGFRGKSGFTLETLIFKCQTKLARVIHVARIIPTSSNIQEYLACIAR